MFISELIHSDVEGWLILADVTDDDFIFYSAEFYENEPRTITIPIDKRILNSEKFCDVRYTEYEDFSELYVGKNVFYYGSIKDIKASTGDRLQELANRVNYGQITHINIKDKTAVINNEVVVKLFTIISHEHNYEQIKDTDVKICGVCKAIYAPYRASNVGA